jgi:HSP20 family protein
MEKNPMRTRYEHPLSKLINTFWDDSLPLIDDQIKNTHLTLAEDEKAVYVEANLPGLDSSEIDVTLDNKMLWIRGHKKEVQDEKKYHYRSKKSYSYQITLPESIDDSKDPITKYEHGVLCITFLKSKGDTTRKIHIK